MTARLPLCDAVLIGVGRHILLCCHELHLPVASMATGNGFLGRQQQQGSRTTLRGVVVGLLTVACEGEGLLHSYIQTTCALRAGSTYAARRLRAKTNFQCDLAPSYCTHQWTPRASSGPWTNRLQLLVVPSGGQRGFRHL